MRTDRTDRSALASWRSTETSPDPIRNERGGDCDAFERLCGERSETAKELPRVHELIKSESVASLRAHLEKHPKDLATRDALGDLPLHRVADRGSVIRAELLDELGADHLAEDRRGLHAGHRAAESHPQTAAFLFERARAAKRAESSVITREALTERLANTDLSKHEDIDALAADLCGLKVSDLNAARQVVKNRTHFESVKGAILEMKSEGWWQAEFGPQRVRSLLSAIARIDDEGSPYAGARDLLIGEVTTQLDLIRSIRRVRETSKCNVPLTRRSAMNLEASLVTPRIIGDGIIGDDREVTLALGWKGHAIYGGFVKLRAAPDYGHDEPTLLVRIDNRGGGSRLDHDEDEDGAIVSRYFHVPLSYLESAKGKAAFEDFVAKLLLVKATPDSKAGDFYKHVADFKRLLKEATSNAALVESAYGVPPEAALPPQIAGNCVVANTFPGLQARLGPEVYDWFTGFERDLARALVHDFADPNALIDEECRERDEREIGKLLDGDGPWGARLAAVFDAATYNGVGCVASEVTAEQLTRVIEDGDSRALKLLLAHGAPIEEQDDRDRTPLHIAARAGDEACVAALIDAGATVNAMDSDGNTPLHLAVRASSSASVSILLAHGADRDRENNDLVTPRRMIDDQVDQTLLISKSLRAKDADVVPIKRRGRPFAKTGT